MRLVTKGVLAAVSICSSFGGLAQEGAAAPARTAAPGTAGFTEEQARRAVGEHVSAKLAEGGGFYRIADERTGEQLELEFIDIAIIGVTALWQIHDPEHRRSSGSGYFACTDFNARGVRDKVYDVDMWVAPRDGKLQVVDVRIHMAPELVHGKWVKVARYQRTH
jgi:hypothetical protein